MNQNMVGVVLFSLQVDITVGSAIPQNESVDSNKLAIEITKARLWLKAVVQQVDTMDVKDRQQYDYTLFWVNTQQKILDELEGWEI